VATADTARSSSANQPPPLGGFNLVGENRRSSRDCGEKAPAVRAVDEDDDAFRRLAVAVAKYWVCKRTPPLVAEALECLGGNGYVEESGLPRIFREAHSTRSGKEPAT